MSNAWNKKKMSKLQDSSSALRRRLKKYERPDLLVIDEIGYLSYDSVDLLFEVINRRYEKGGIILTTNLAFKDWHRVFPGVSGNVIVLENLTSIRNKKFEFTSQSFRLAMKHTDKRFK